MPEQRPHYHVQAPANWLNDPNGPIHWRGAYHLFYQHNPYATHSDAIHWGHVVSQDLAHWRHLPVALAPTAGGPDADGCWSGCAVDHDGIPTLMYTAVRREGAGWRQTQCLAEGSDDLLTWRKRPENPVIAAPPPEVDAAVFRDPCLWRQDGRWHCVLASSVRGVGGTILLYTSPDLINWQYAGRPLTGDVGTREPVWSGEVWECPQFFALGDRQVLIISVDRARYTVCYVGTFAGGRFLPETVSKFDHGAGYYAPISMLDAKGRRLVWGWSPEARSPAAQAAAGWSGLLTLPRVLTLGADHRLRIRPAPELEVLRGQGRRVADLTLEAGEARLPSGMAGDCLELLAELVPGEAVRAGLAVRCSPDGEEQTRIVYDRAAGTLSVDRSRSSRSPDVEHDTHGGPLSPDAGGAVRLHVFLDRSIVEVYANNRLCLTERIYPTREDSLGIRLFAEGGAAQLRSLEVWELHT